VLDAPVALTLAKKPRAYKQEAESATKLVWRPWRTNSFFHVPGMVSQFHFVDKLDDLTSKHSS
jgi:hypothetical protein